MFMYGVEFLPSHIYSEFWLGHADAANFCAIILKGLRIDSQNLFKVDWRFCFMKWQGEVKTVGQEVDDGKVKDVVVVESGEEVVSRRATLVLSFASFVGSMIFWSQNVTGNVVLNFDKVSANWVGGILFLLAMVGFLAYVQKRKKD